MPRRDPATGRFMPTYTITYTHVDPQTGQETRPRYAGRTADQVERMGRELIRLPLEQMYDLAVLDSGGEDVVFDFEFVKG